MTDLPSPEQRRKEIAKQLAINAATKPSNVATGSGVAIAGLVLYGLSASSLGLVLLPVALLIYTILTVLSFFDENEATQLAESRKQAALSERENTFAAEKEQLTANIHRLLEDALRQEALVRQAANESNSSMGTLIGEVNELSSSLYSIARRASRLQKYLDSQDTYQINSRLNLLRRENQESKRNLVEALEDQLATINKMGAQIVQFEEEMEHVTTVLATMHGQIVQMSVDEESLGEVRLTEMARDLRLQVGDAADSMAQVAAQM